MPSHASLLALWALTVGIASAHPLSDPSVLSPRQSTGSSSCTSLHIFLIRGWNEDYPGRQSALVDVICAGLDSETGCDYEDVVYDTLATYCTAIETGRAAGVSQITAYAERCPDAKLVVSGFSEGANVLGDVLGGGTCTIPGAAGLNVTTAPGSSICAATLFGDGRHVANQAYNVLNGSAYDGEFPRSLNATSLAGLNTFSSVLRSYCQDTDQICAYSDGTPWVEEDHTDYFDLYSEDAGSWIRDMCDVGSSSTSSSSSVSATPSATSTVTTSTVTTSTVTSTSATASATSSSVCTAGTVISGLSGNYEGLCSFTCSYGYCPSDVCECTATGAQATEPAITGEDGCPLDGESESYSGLCSYACNHGYCPSTACQECSS